MKYKFGVEEWYVVILAGIGILLALEMLSY